MRESNLVYDYLIAEDKLLKYNLSVSAVNSGFYIHDRKGNTIADCKTVDSLLAFAQSFETIPTLTVEIPVLREESNIMHMLLEEA